MHQLQLPRRWHLELRSTFCYAEVSTVWPPGKSRGTLPCSDSEACRSSTNDKIVKLSWLECFNRDNGHFEIDGYHPLSEGGYIGFARESWSLKSARNQSLRDSLGYVYWEPIDRLGETKYRPNKHGGCGRKLLDAESVTWVATEFQVQQPWCRAEQLLISAEFGGNIGSLY